MAEPYKPIQRPNRGAVRKAVGSHFIAQWKNGLLRQIRIKELLMNS